MSRVLFLDDDESRHMKFRRENIGHQVVHVYTADVAIQALNEAVYDLASLDGDLDWQASAGLTPLTPTGVEVAKHIAEMPADRRPRKVVIHSINRGRAREMWRVLKLAGVDAEREPFGGV